MSIASIGSSLSTIDAPRRQDAVQPSESAAPSGNIANAPGRQTQSPATSEQSGGAFHNPIEADLTAIMNSVQAGNFGAARNALQQLSADQEEPPYTPNSVATSQNAFVQLVASQLKAAAAGDATTTNGTQNPNLSNADNGGAAA